MAYLANDFQHLDDLYIANLDGAGERQLTHLNSALWAQLELQPIERFTYKSTDEWSVEGFFVKPLGWQAGKKYPMVLVIHGGRDYRVVDTQGMSTFTALQRRGIPSRFLYFPDENHWVLKPQNSVLWHQTVLEWLDRYSRPANATR